MSKVQSYRDLIRKSCLLIDQGKLIRGPIDLCIGDNFHLLGFWMEGDDMIALKDVLSYDGDVIVLRDDAEKLAVEGHSLIDLLVMTREGKYFGNVEDFTLDGNGEVQELLLSDMRPGKLEAIGFLPRSVFEKIGEEVLFVGPEAKDKYRKETYDAKEDGLGDIFGKRLSSSVSEFSHRVNEKMKQVDREAISQDLARLTGLVNREFSRILDGVLDQVGSKRVHFEEDDLSAIIEELRGHTVSKPILDRRGEVILMPGQLISEERVRKVVEAEKVAELYRLAQSMEEQ